MKRLLCVTDFSETANNAVAYAAKLAQATSTELTLLNVQSLFDFTAANLIEGRSKSIEQARQRLEDQCNEVSRAFKISCSAEVGTSSQKLSSAIGEWAKDYDLLVMGSNGPDDLYQLFGGSNTYNAILKASIPVLVIPAGVTYSEIRSVVYAFDYLRERDLPLSGLKPFIQQTHSKLRVLQVMEEAYSKDAEDDLKELQFIIKTYHTEVDYEFDTVRSADIAQSVNTYVLRTGADVLALCSMSRNILERLFHKSVIQNISGVTSYPVLVFHP